jgi:hypothetical protein
MPSLRHLLPVSIFAAVAWAWAVDSLMRTPILGGASHASAFLFAVIVVLAGAQIAGTDSRLSRIDKHDKPWALPKTADKARDAWLSMKRIEPPHITLRGPFEMGLITQNYRVLETCTAPLEDSWYVGRDIGKVGFYTEVRVFDTAGLFTPDLVRNDAWRRKHQVGPELVRAAFARPPVAAELLDEWTAASGKQPGILAPYSLAQGTAGEPVDLVKRDCERPSPAEVLRRYERSLAKFPRWFYLQTLYGESVGAAMQKRVRIVRELVRIHEQYASATPALPNLGSAAGAGAVLGGNFESLGCEVSPNAVAPGAKVTVTCWWRAVARSTSLYNAFIHFQDEHGTVLFNGDHPAGGLSRTTDWKPGELVRDDVEVLVPAGMPAGSYAIFYGMWNGDGRAAVLPPSMNDGKDRISAGVLTVAR